MAFKKPTVKTITADIGNLSIYLRSVKKFGKSTLFKNMILAKYGNPEYGMLVEIGHEVGDSLLDNVNTTHVDTYKDFIELKDWLIKEKGKEHNIKIVGFDVVDELVPIFEKEVIRLSNIENPSKKCKSIKSAFGGYNAGVEMAASLIKEYMSEIKKAGFGIVAIAHTKMKGVKEKGSIEEESYMQLTSNLQNAYESAFGDVMDLVLTGYIDRNLETVGEGDNKKKYATDAIRKLYFRGTSLIDAGSRFSSDAVPEYLVFDRDDMGEIFVKTIEDAIEKSKTISTSSKRETKKVEKKPVPVEETVEDDIDDIEDNVVEETTTSNYPDDLEATIRTMFKECTDKELKTEVKTIISSFGKLSDCDEGALKEIYDKLK